MVTKIPKIIIIIFIALILRSWQITKIPSLNPDEAALGYNAYSLLKTGRDEHGAAWPLHFKSFGDYKPGAYVYLSMPFVKTIGLNPLAVRLPNLIFSVATIYVLYLLINLLTKNNLLANIVSLILSISPWHLQFSRGAWESSTALFFLILGIYWFYKYIFTKKNIYIFIFPIPLVVSLATYHSVRVIAPILLLSIVLLNLKKLLNKQFLIAIFIGLILVSPVIISFFKNGGTTRFGGVGITADTGPLSRSEELLNQHSSVNLLDRFLHNRRLLYTMSWVEKYTSHFNLNFLFISGDEVPRSKNPDMAQLYILELPFLIYGLVKLIKSKNSHLKQFSLLFLFISPLASSLTFQAPSALRSLPLVIPISIIVGIGIEAVFTSYLKQNRIKLLISIILLIGYLVSVLYYLDSYYNHAPKRYSFAWNSGFSEVVPIIENEKNKYNQIYVTDKYDQPYILYLFFSRYSPQNLQSQIKLTTPDKFGFSTVLKIDNINFGIPKEIPKNSLIIDSSDFEKTGESFKIYNN